MVYLGAVCIGGSRYGKGSQQDWHILSKGTEARVRIHEWIQK
jgi:hypothetical protein